VISLTDQFDQASKLAQLEISKALQNHQQRKEKPLVINGVRCCLDCEIAVEPKRVTLVDSIRCIGCQVHHEALQKYQRG
jgi:hypothetical protein